MKHPITLRLDPDLLARAKGVAKTENRTLTNFIETVLKQRIEAGADPVRHSRDDDGALPRQAAPQAGSEQPKKGAHR